MIDTLELEYRSNRLTSFSGSSIPARQYRRCDGNSDDLRLTQEVSQRMEVKTMSGAL